MKINLSFFLVFLSFIGITNVYTNQRNHVFIYAGPGVGEKTLKQTLLVCNNLLKPSYFVSKISPEEIKNENWEEKTALLIIPGGADIPYARSLNGPGNKKISSYVQNGGSLIGICAGSYYCGEYVEFAKGTTLEVLGKRELGFFPGVVRGPILAPYEYQSSSGAKGGITESCVLAK